MSFAVSASVSAAIPVVPASMPDGVVGLPTQGDIANGADEASADASATALPAFLDVLGLLNAPSGTGPGAATDAAIDESQDESVAVADDAAPAMPAMPAMAALPSQLLMVLPVPVPPAPVVGESEKPRSDQDDTVLSVGAAPEAPGSMHASRSADGAAPRKAVLPEMAAALVDDDARAGTRGPRPGNEAGLPVDPVPATTRTAAIIPARTAAPVASEFHLEDVGAPPMSIIATQPAERDLLPAVKLSPATPAQWRQPLAEALGDCLQLSLQRGNDQAVIRLDPPQLGRIDIAIRHEAGSLQVQLSATHSEVVRQLHAIGDSLRQDLGQRAYGDVSVVVSDAAMGRDADGRSRGRPQQPEDTGPGRALAEAESGSRMAFRMGDDTSKVR